MTLIHSDSRDSTSSNAPYNDTSFAPDSVYSALVSASPSSSWPMSSHTLMRLDSDASTATSQPSSVAMRRDSSNASWMPSPYRSCMSSFGKEPSSYLSDDDLLFTATESSSPSSPSSPSPLGTMPTVAPKKELTTEEQIVNLRELQEKEAAHHHQHQHSESSISKRRVVRFADPGDESKPRRRSTLKMCHTTVRCGLNSLNGPQ
ncbi:hypothetical protein LTR47_012018 [Exophiala xenobiotica]|nr:hypothetical protein LTR47_012018 [Exophiala xenobiotica]